MPLYGNATMVVKGVNKQKTVFGKEKECILKPDRCGGMLSA